MDVHIKNFTLSEPGSHFTKHPVLMSDGFEALVFQPLGRIVKKDILTLTTHIKVQTDESLLVTRPVMIMNLSEELFDH